MTEQEIIAEAHVKALAACKRAAKAGKRHIRLQSHKRDGYRLAAVNHNFGGSTSYCFDMPAVEWAQNVVYRLRECCLLPVGVDAIDEYFLKISVGGLK